MSSTLSPAMAWALASKVALIDARHCDPLTAAEKRAEAFALIGHAVKLDGDYDMPIRAQAYLEQTVEPAAHYAREMTASERARVYGLRDCDDAHAGICPKCFGWVELRGQESAASEACTCPERPQCAPAKPRKPATCRVISNAEYAERVRKINQKPSPRRRTKPASLPQRLAEAAHSIKEP